MTDELVLMAQIEQHGMNDAKKRKIMMGESLVLQGKNWGSYYWPTSYSRLADLKKEEADHCQFYELPLRSHVISA